MDQSGFARAPLVVYGVNLLAAGVAYFVLQRVIFRTAESGPVLRQALGRDLKGRSSPAFYILGIALAFWSPLVGLACYTVVAVMWLVPDPRLERFLEQNEASRT
jgi:hypothetical protein